MGSGNTGRVIAAGAIGNVLEWYDFAIYGYFAAAIGRTVFPREDPVAQVLLAFGIEWPPGGGTRPGRTVGEETYGRDRLAPLLDAARPPASRTR
jgi:hypothetical protein